MPSSAYPRSLLERGHPFVYRPCGHNVSPKLARTLGMDLRLYLIQGRCFIDLTLRNVPTVHSRVLFKRDADPSRARRLLRYGEGGFYKGTNPGDEPGRTITVQLRSRRSQIAAKAFVRAHACESLSDHGFYSSADPVVGKLV